MMESVAIIGAGITGLTAGFRLHRSGVPVTIYEAGDRPGGVIRTLRENGFLAEFGPNTILETSPKIGELIREAGLDARKLDPDPGAGARFVVRYGRPIEMPGSLPGFLATKLFTPQAKLALLREPFVPPRRDGFEESIAEFATRRLGKEFLDQAIDALVAGIYAGDPYKLSVRHAFPKLAQLEEKYGSLIKGQIFGAAERKRRGEIAKDRAPKFSFDEGLQVLPETLSAHLGASVQFETAATKLSQTRAGWTLDLIGPDGERRARHRAVIFACTAPRLAELSVESAVPLDFSPFSEIRHPPVASVVLGFRREAVAHPCRGFGALVPKIEGFKILGTIFSSALFPNRAPKGHLTLTSYVGGERYPDLALLPQEKLIALVCADLGALFGVSGKPVFAHCVVYPKAIPQYNVGYGRFKQLMDEAETKAPGLFFAGHYRDGVSSGDSIVSGIAIAGRVASALSGQGSHGL
jgi:oxygen-dependent protoporphyrinogen oxidase